MTDTSTAAVMRLMDGVTEGPWESVASTPMDGVECFFIKSRRDFGPITRGFRITEIASVNGPQWDEQRSTARFIAAARDLVPALLAERDALTARAEAAEAALREAVEAMQEITLSYDRKWPAERARAFLAKNNTPKPAETESKLQRTIAARDRRIARLEAALNDARAKGYVTAAEEGPQVVLSHPAQPGRNRHGRPYGA